MNTPSAFHRGKILSLSRQGSSRLSWETGSRGITHGTIRSSTRRLPYENLTGIWDSSAPDNAETLLYWGHVSGHDEGDYSDQHLRNPVIWGPSYATGFAVSGSIGRFDYAAEIKNAALASRPESWDLTNRCFDHPTFSGRVGIRPNEMWDLGFSASGGPYLLAEASSSLPGWTRPW